MTKISRWLWTGVLTLASLLLVAVAASAQDEVGALYGTVTDTRKEPLPGVRLSLAGMGASRLQTSDSLGKFRFLGLDPGDWSLEASLDGFSSLEYPGIRIRAARNTSIEIQLTAAIEEIISVTAESPALDERKLDAGTRVSQIELEKIPTGRDPWAILTQAPGVLVNRVDVGGGEGDQQALFRGQGSRGSENDYVLDGIQSTAERGSTIIYYDFDQFEEIQVATGGNDVAKNTMGVAINLVTKRGTNEMRGSARFLLTDGAGYFGALEQADPGWEESDLGPGQTEFVGDSIDRIQEQGLEAGGPAWRDHIWLWGSWAQKDINKVTGGGAAERFILDNTAVKLNSQLSPANSFVGSFNSSEKRATGRGSAPNVDASATFDQRGPTGITKLEDSHVFGSSLFLSGQYSFIDSGFLLAAQGGSGPDQPPIPSPGGEMNRDANSYLTNNFTYSRTNPIEEWKLDGSYFFNSSGTNHELKFGGRVRKNRSANSVSYPGRNIQHYAGNLVGVQDPALLAWAGLPPDRYLDAHMVYAYRQGPAPVTIDYESAWIQDTMTRGRWTFNAGFRYDLQNGENESATVEANRGFPEVMPALSFAGNDGDGLEWRSLSPRLGVTCALGEQRKTLLRGSLSQFPAAFLPGLISRVNPVAGQWAVILFLDEPGGHSAFYDDGEPYSVLGGLWGFDPANPTALSSSDRNDPEMDLPITSEVILSAEHALLPELAIGLSLTWRRLEDYEDSQPLFTDLATGKVRTASAEEYLPDRVVSGTLPDGRPYSFQTYFANPGLASTGGELYTDGDRKVESFSAALTVTKRLSNRWMARGYLNYVFREAWVVPASHFEHNDPNRTLPGVSIDGETFVPLVHGSTIGLQADWQWNLNGMVQVAPERPWGFNVAANLSGRQGYPVPYFRWVIGLDGKSRRIMVVDSVTDYRYDDVLTADLRLEKEFAGTSNLGLIFSIDGFNIFNEGTVLGRENNLGSARTNWVLQTVSPRVWRLGVRLSWR